MNKRRGSAAVPHSARALELCVGVEGKPLTLHALPFLPALNSSTACERLFGRTISEPCIRKVGNPEHCSYENLLA